MDKLMEGFELLEDVGQGATAKVVRARRRATGEMVALKIFHPHMVQRADFAKRLQREIAIGQGLDHPSILKTVEVIEQDPPVIVMPFIDGEELGAFQRKLPYVLPELSILTLLPVLSALTTAHEKGIVHRDIKPSNIMVSRAGRIFLTDFGVARVLNENTLTHTNEFIGSVLYMSPEQASGGYVGPASDLYSFSAVLYFLLTGTHVFTRDSLPATLSAIRSDSPEAVFQRNPKVSKELNALILKGLAKKPEDRFKNAAEYEEKLTDYLALTGFGTDAGAFDDWIRQGGGGSQTSALITSSVQFLLGSAEAALHAHDKEKFIRVLSVLSARSPGSEALHNLMERYNSRWGVASNRKSWLIGLVFVTVVGLAVGIWVKRSTLRGGPLLAVPPSTEIETIVPVEDTKAPAVLDPKPIPEVPRKARAVTPPKAAAGTVILVTPDKAEVFWDYKRVDPRSPLLNQTPGFHSLVVNPLGKDVIRRTVEVKAGESTKVTIDD